MLEGLTWDDDPFREDKKQTVEAFVADFRKRLAKRAPKGAWTKDVAAFYRGQL